MHFDRHWGFFHLGYLSAVFSERLTESWGRVERRYRKLLITLLFYFAFYEKKSKYWDGRYGHRYFLPSVACSTRVCSLTVLLQMKSVEQLSWANRQTLTFRDKKESIHQNYGFKWQSRMWQINRDTWIMYHTSIIVQVICTHHFHDNVTSRATPAHLTNTVPPILIKSAPPISITETWATI